MKHDNLQIQILVLKYSACLLLYSKQWTHGNISALSTGAMAWPQSCIFKSLASNRFICSVVCLYWKLKSGPCGAEGASVNFPHALWDAPSFSCSVSGLHFFLLPAPAAAKPHIAQGFLSSMPNFLPRQYEWLWIPSSPAAAWHLENASFLCSCWRCEEKRKLPRIQFFLSSLLKAEPIVTGHAGL